MRLQNLTTVPDDEIRRIIAAVRPNGIANFSIRVTYNSGYGCSGRYYERRNHVILRIPRWEKRHVAQPRPGKGYLHGYAIGSIAEGIVMVMAHELRHAWQAVHRRGYRVWGSRGVYSERDADAYGLQQLRRYRRGEIAPLSVPRVQPKVKKVEAVQVGEGVKARIEQLCQSTPT